MAKGIRTLQRRSVVSRLRVHGFRARTAKSPNTLLRRRAKGRKQLTIAG